MSLFIAVALSLLYLLFLFLIANQSEKKYEKYNKYLNNAHVYTLSMAVYCTAWTYFGSVGKSSIDGVNFLAIYFGPTIAAILFIPIYQKFITIRLSIGYSSMADFISIRYGKNISLGAFVTLLFIVSVVPYMTLQLKAISDSLILFHNKNVIVSGKAQLYKSIVTYISMVLGVFIIIYGFRSPDIRDKRNGLVTAIAFESLFKLVSFIVVGVAIVVLTLDSGVSIFNSPANQKIFSTEQFFKFGNQIDWFGNILLSFFAFLFLPRQFQMGVIENNSISHLKKATWMFPLYLLIINIFVIPIAFCGNAIFDGQVINPDSFLLAIPLKFNQNIFAFIGYLGGFAAASSMIIVETIALSVMLSNNIILPLYIRIQQMLKFDYLKSDTSKIVLHVRWIGVFVVILLSMFYDQFVHYKFQLVNIGLTSFVAISQFAPAMLGALYWEKANVKGVVAGLITGFTIWFLLLIYPNFSTEHQIYYEIINDFFSINSDNFKISKITLAFFISISSNFLLFFLFSVFTKRNQEELFQSKIFNNLTVYESYINNDSKLIYKTTEIIDLLTYFVGEDRLSSLLETFKKNGINMEQTYATPKLIEYSQKALSGILGVASARLLFKTFGEMNINNTEIIDVLTEKQEIKIINRELVQKQQALNAAQEELQAAYKKLEELHDTKDEFLYTITHELRTPLTSIRAFSEILHEHQDIDLDTKNKYLEVIAKESTRLSHIINQVLDLEKLESGMNDFSPQFYQLNNLIVQNLDGLESLILQKNIKIKTEFENLPLMFIDAQLINQVLNNLLSNAIKYSNNASVITIQTKIEDDNGYFLISNEGHHILLDNKEALFDKFFQVHKNKQNKPTGSGLGLAICKRIISLHKGEIKFENIKQGVLFYFKLPIKMTSND